MAVRSNHVIDATITITQTTSEAFAAVVQLLGINGKDLTNRGQVDWYLSKDAYGDTLATDSTDITTLAAGTDGVVIEHNANVAGKAISESDGDIDFALAVPSGKTVYLVLCMPDGTLIVSNAMTYGM